MSPSGTLAAGWRGEAWARLADTFDVAVVGGGITGAGILRLAACLGLRAVLVEQGDFASGTSSRSSKLVHGGLRYLAQGQVAVTRTSVVERERLLRDAPGLVEPLGFLMPAYRGDHPGRVMYGLGLTAYDLLAGRRTHRHLRAAELELVAPHVATDGLSGGYRYEDAQTDDARLTLRVLLEAVEHGAVAMNYVRAEEPLVGSGNGTGRVAGVAVRDLAPGGDGRTAEVRASVVVNATGAWADGLRMGLGRPARIRPLQGSHVVFPAWRLPVAQAISFLHPGDRRPVFVFPWEGVSLLGTTDVDTSGPIAEEPGISCGEIDYLLEAARRAFPSLGLDDGDILTTFAGVRPVIGSGKADPSKESREHVVWDERGLLTVTGGKLTTFGAIARDALRAVRDRLPLAGRIEPAPLLDPSDGDAGTEFSAASSLATSDRRRLLGRYGAAAPPLIAAARDGELDLVPGTPTRWVEVRWAARAEGCVHLDDLLLRRTRLGILLGDGGLDAIERIRSIAQPELGWDDGRWIAEVKRYRETWSKQHAVAGRARVRATDAASAEG